MDFSGVKGDFSGETLLVGEGWEVRFSGVLTSFLILDVLESGESSGDLVRLLRSLCLPGAGDEVMLPFEKSLSGGRFTSEACFQEPSLHL